MGLCHAPLAISAERTELDHWSLENGAKCVIAPIPDAPLTCVDFWCRAGSAVERPGEEGLAHFLEHMVFKGSSTLDAGEFDLRIEALGGSSNAATGFDDVHFYVLVPPKEVKAALELLLNLVITPKIDKQAYSLEREVVLEEIAQYNDQPDEQVFQKLLEKCWPKHPYGRSILGKEESLRKSNPCDMKAFHQRHYMANNCCLVISGVIPKGIEEIVSNSLLTGLENSSKEESTPPKDPSLVFYKGREEVFFNRLESSRLLMAWQLPPANNQRMLMGADLATSLLSEGRRSRLVQQLRENLQIVESIDMDLTVLEEGSLVMLEACCGENNLEKVEQEVHKILKDMSHVSSLEKELERAARLVENGLCFNLEAASQVSGLAGSQSLWGRDQPLLEPLRHIKYWDSVHLKEEVFNLLQPEQSFTLLARPLKAS